MLRRTISGAMPIVAVVIFLCVLVSCSSNQVLELPPFEEDLEARPPCILVDLVNNGVDSVVKLEVTESLVKSLDKACGEGTIHGRILEEALSKRGAFNPRECTTSICIAKIGSALDGWLIFWGHVSFDGTKYEIRMQRIDVKTAIVQETITDTTEHPEDLKFVARIIIFKLFGYHKYDPDLYRRK